MSDAPRERIGRTLAEHYRAMVTIRTMELQLAEAFAAGEIPGFIHLSVGQEAVAVGIASALRDGDTFATTHRGHGHAIANGVDLVRFAQELFGRAPGLCAGRGGSMHVADLSIGMLGANGIVGAGVPIATGSALAHQVLGREAIAVALFGDGALGEGAVYESLNLAQLWRLPLLVVCENNGWSEFSPADRMYASSPAAFAAAFGVPHERIDGNDVEAVATAAARAVAAVRAGAGPRMLECITHRHRGHFEGDPQRYRAPDELARLAEHDSVVRTRRTLLARGHTETTLATLESAAAAVVADALAAARAAPLPEASAVPPQVYAEASDA
jgi:pyruvate dehydrogenase E1 component alpha subunit